MREETEPSVVSEGSENPVRVWMWQGLTDRAVQVPPHLRNYLLQEQEVQAGWSECVGVAGSDKDTQRAEESFLGNPRTASECGHIWKKPGPGTGQAVGPQAPVPRPTFLLESPPLSRNLLFPNLYQLLYSFMPPASP